MGMHAKYEVLISYCSNVMINFLPQTVTNGHELYQICQSNLMKPQNYIPG